MKTPFYRYMIIVWTLTIFSLYSNVVSAGELIKGRYIKETRWEYIVDKQNKILWQDNSAVKNNILSWQEAKAYCARLGIDGIKKWRLPTLVESKSIYTEHGQDVDVFKHGSREGVYVLNLWSLEGGEKILNYFNGKVEATSEKSEPRTRCVSDSGYKEVFATLEATERKVRDERVAAENKVRADRSQALNQLLALGARGLYLEAGKAQRNGSVTFVNTRFGANELYEMIVDKFSDSEYAVKASDQLTAMGRSSREQSAAYSAVEQSDSNAKQRAYNACKIEMDSCYSRTNGKGSCYRDCGRLR